MPESVVDAISYYNVPLSPTVGHLRNPLRTLQAVARREDFVVLKMDVEGTEYEVVVTGLQTQAKLALASWRLVGPGAERLMALHTLWRWETRYGCGARSTWTR